MGISEWNERKSPLSVTINTRSENERYYENSSSNGYVAFFADN